MRLVVALGGHALLHRGEEPTADAQRRNVVVAAKAVAALARDHEVLVTHGNGPQVGLLALQAEAVRGGAGARAASPPGLPLDVLGAQSEGMIGYMVAQELQNQLPEREVATLLTQVEVDPTDPAFEHPTKPIGPSYNEAEARRLAELYAWEVASEGSAWRRVVPSPTPLRILEVGTLRLLVRHGVLVVCAGGGGVPVIFDAWGRVHGVEAVIDKDRTASLLAREVEADGLLLLTDVDGVYRGWGTDVSERIPVLSTEEVEDLDLAVGSMGPKVRACVEFVSGAGPRFAAIGALEESVEVLAGETGTRVVR